MALLTSIMADFFNPFYITTKPILGLLEGIAKKQGVLDTIKPSSVSYGDILAMANVDAVHYSTRIEGNALTHKQVTQTLSQNKRNIKSTRDLKEIINYSKARQMLFDRTNKNEITLDLINNVHQYLMDGIVRGKLKGHLRESQNAIYNGTGGAIVYMPPLAADVKTLLRSLTHWLRAESIHQNSSLMVAAIFHYQFVTIHPYMDGNGRLARLLTNHILHTNGYTVSLFASLEKQHERDRALYYRSLRALQRDNFYDIHKDTDLAPWIEYWMGCLNRTYDEALERLDQGTIRENETGMQDRLGRAVALFTRHKRLKASDYEALMHLSRTQAVDDLNKLIEKGLIQKVGGGRSTVYEVCRGSP